MMMMPDMTGFYILLGIGLLVGGLVALLKIGLWIWIMTHFFHRSAPYQEPARTAPQSAPKSIKAWLGVIATVLGILTTTVGLVKECSPSQEKPSQPAQQNYYQPPQAGNQCCTPAGRCMLMMTANVGMTCTCMDLYGNFAQGSVCQ